MSAGKSRIRCCLWCLLASACGVCRLGAEAQGQATVSLQGYYMGTGGQSLVDSSGVAVRIQQFLPKLGLLEANLESFGSQGRMQLGDNYLELRGVAWRGARWTARGGDCRIAPGLTEFPFYNFFNPELMVRGGCVQARRGSLTFSLFGGIETVQTGPRIPFRTSTGQGVGGVSLQYRYGDRLEVGTRFIRLENPGTSADRETFLFPLNRRFSSADIYSVQALYRVISKLRLYAEQSAALGRYAPEQQFAGRHPWSSIFGVVWESQRLTLRANYTELESTEK